MAGFDNEVFLKDEDLDLLYEISVSIHSIHDMDEMFRNDLFKIKEVFQIEVACMALHDADCTEFYFINNNKFSHF